MKSVYFFTLFFILYTWAGYLLLLVIFSKIKASNFKTDDTYPSVTILLTVHNEEKIIETRIQNLLESDYSEDMLEILVASDGSTDRTDEIAESLIRQDNRIKLFKTQGGGKSATQNKAIPDSNGEIVILTDAGSLFEKSTVKNIVRNFADERVGCVTGRLVLKGDCTAVSENQGFYWKYEMLLRNLESRLGILHTGSGVALALRKSLFVPFESKYGDDCIIPLDVISQGYKVIHEEEAVAYDAFPSSMEGELKARIRMTLRNFTCTLSKCHLLNPFKYPLIFVSILSHKIFRWLTPYFMIVIFIANLLLLKQGFFWQISFYCQLFFYLMGIVGFIAEKNKIRVPLASQIFSFLLANTGFFMGVLNAILGRRIISYKNR
jgi:cellulose synthase/poly-beta-1,6-N-acetylglucosamine synthase-like glycosyltransferase